jgi:hypothetical protein
MREKGARAFGGGIRDYEQRYPDRAFKAFRALRGVGDDSTFIAFIGGVRKPSRIRDVTEELLEKGMGGLIVTGASKQRQD